MPILNVPIVSLKLLFMLLVCSRLRWSHCLSSAPRSRFAAAFQSAAFRQPTITRLFSSSSEAEISPSDHGTSPLRQLDKGTDFHWRLTKVIKAKQLIEPTPIQKYAIPLLTKGYDVLASASTGSGKTYMFVFPLLHQLMSSKTRPGDSKPRALILNPTRELAMQTASVLQDLRMPGISIGLAVGGIRQQHHTVDVLVGTPGRVLQLCDERRLQLRHVQVAVVDEADRMLDLGFEPQLQRIARQLSNPERQTVLCSATFPEAVQRVASEYLKESYYFVATGKVGGLRPNVEHQLLWKNKQTRFQDALQSKDTKALVFANTKVECERLGRTFTNARVVTGDKSQGERNQAVANLASGRHKLLVATDVAARGLDVPDIDVVLQVDAPRDVDTWVHRVGRTGRGMNTTGAAVTYLNAANMKLAGPMIELLKTHPTAEIPRWMYGMAHVAHARELDELGAIAAGGGGVETPTELTEVDNTQFSTQDFRRTAQEGTFGSERDTTYASFDQDAYSSLDKPVVETETIEHVASSKTNSVGNETMPKSSADATPDDIAADSERFQRCEPSQELSQALHEISGSVTLNETRPQKDVLRKLSQRSDDRLRFEYIGHFPFSEIESILRSPKQAVNVQTDGMLRVLMVAEKPSIAKAIADALSGPRGPRQRRGISRALPVYEFTTDQFKASPEQGGSRSLVTVTSVVGHVFSLGFQDGRTGSGRKNIDPSEYFDMPVVKQEEGSTGKLRVVDHLRALAANMDHLVLWLDCDAEGENIAHEVIGVTRRALEQHNTEGNPSDSDDSSARRIHRATFSSITKEALKDAFGNLGEPNEKLSRSVDARQELDLRVGVAFTRLLTWRCVGYARRRFAASTKLVSYGPCQTPALSFCVDRAQEIERFTPTSFTKIKASANPPDKKTVFNLRWISDDSVENNSKRGKIVEESATKHRQVAKDVVELAEHPQAHLVVSSVEEKSETIKAPVGLNTVALLSAGSRAMGMSPKGVLKVAEQLYSQGLVSYPRTESTRYDPNGFNVQRMLRDHSKSDDWGKTAAHLLRTKYSTTSRPPSRGRDVGDHPPITCLKSASREEVGGGVAWRVYDFISRTFLGSLSDDLHFTRRVANLELVSPLAGAEKHIFEVETVSVDSPGFAAACTWVLRDIGAERKESETLKLQPGMKLNLKSVKAETCTTRPPPFLQEHELIELMDKNRIGTDASMATHVSNIVDRGYVVLCDETGVPVRPPRPPTRGKRPPRQVGRYLVPTSLGSSLIHLFDDATTSRYQADTDDSSVALLARPQIRAQMEEEVKTIATGDLDKQACVDQNISWFRTRYNEFARSLSRGRLGKFERSMEDTRSSLQRWKKLGAFEPGEAAATHNHNARQRQNGSPSKQSKPRWTSKKGGPPKKKRDGNNKGDFKKRPLKHKSKRPRSG